MDPATASAISGGAILSGAITGGMGLLGTAYSNTQSVASAREQMRFQERMSNTAHQRQVEDLRKAGLNPMLSALGQGASSPGGQSASINDLGPNISKGAETALAVRQQNEELKNIKEDTQLKEANKFAAENTAAKTARESLLLQSKLFEQQETNAQAMIQTEMMKKVLPSQVKKAIAEGDYARVNQLMGIIKAGTSSAADIVDMINPLKLRINLKGKK